MAIAFLCVGNSCRSQMAEGIARQLAPEREIWSAGSAPAAQISPVAVEVMKEIEIDISSARPKKVDALPLERIELVITLCAEQVCPVLPADAKKLHWPLPDPEVAVGTGQEVRVAYREVRDELRLRLGELLGG